MLPLPAMVLTTRQRSSVQISALPWVPALMRLRRLLALVLTDNSFSSIVTGVEQGRLVFDNMKKVVLYLLPAGSWSEMLPVVAAVFLGMPQPLSAFQMIIICMFTDLFPSLALVYEDAEADIMHLPPRNTKKQHLVDMRLLAHAYLNIGMLESLAAFVIFFHYMNSYGDMAPADLLLAFDKWEDGYKGNTMDQLNELLWRGPNCIFRGLGSHPVWQCVVNPYPSCFLVFPASTSSISCCCLPCLPRWRSSSSLSLCRQCKTLSTRGQFPWSTSSCHLCRRWHC